MFISLVKFVLFLDIDLEFHFFTLKLAGNCFKLLLSHLLLMALELKEGKSFWDISFLFLKTLFLASELFVRLENLLILCKWILHQVNLLLTFPTQKLILLDQEINQRINILDVLKHNDWEFFNKQSNLFLLKQEAGTLKIVLKPIACRRGSRYLRRWIFLNRYLFEHHMKYN